MSGLNGEHEDTAGDDQLDLDTGAGEEEGESDDEALAYAFSVFADEDEDEDFTPPDTTEEAQAMMRELTQGISTADIPDDMIPENFNVNNPQELRGVLKKFLQHTLNVAIPLTLKPVQSAFKNQSKAFESTLSARLSAAGKQSSSAAQMSQQFPLLEHHVHGAIYKPMVAAMNKKGTKPADQLKTLRTMAARLGHDVNAGVSTRGNRRGSQGEGNADLTGAAALDALFGAMPTPKPKK